MQKKTFADIFSIIGTALYAMPVSLAVSVLAGFEPIVGALLGFLSVSVGLFAGQAFTPSWLLFLPAFYLLKEFGTGFAFLVLCGGSLLYLLLLYLCRRFFPNGWTLPWSIRAGLSLGFAFLGTAILTRDYFGISAEGNTGLEMIRSYVSNGFHANWRGVFYGTISLVLMITWRRKFKTGKKYFPAPFMALLVPLLMNLFLNPEAYRTPIYEVGFNNTTHLCKPFLFDGFSLSAGLLCILYMAAMGLGLFVTALQSGYDSRVLSVSAAASALTSPLCCPVLPYEETPIRKKYQFPISGLLAFLLCLYSPLTDRIPLHSLAVILIALGWQAVDWHAIKMTFRCGVLPVAVFLSAFACIVLWDPCLSFCYLFFVVLYVNLKRASDIDKELKI